jgi:hypothetical protein
LGFALKGYDLDSLSAGGRSASGGKHKANLGDIGGEITPPLLSNPFRQGIPLLS